MELESDKDTLILLEEIQNKMDFETVDAITPFRKDNGKKVEPESDDDALILLEEIQNEMEFETVDAITPYRRDNVWTNSETKQLMELYKGLIGKVGFKFLHKKDMWAEISTHFPYKNAKQCEQRYNTVLKRKKKGLTKVYISEARRKTIDCAQNTLKINRTHNRIVKKKDKIVNNTEKRNLTIQETLLEIALKREEAKERRHREKMESIKKMQNILQEILDRKNK